MNKLESGNIVLENKSFDLGKLLDDTNDMIFMQASETGISCSKDMWKIEHRYVLGSPLHFQQVLMNIGGNAVKYNQENGSIRVTCQEISCDDSVPETVLKSASPDAKAYSAKAQNWLERGQIFLQE